MRLRGTLQGKLVAILAVLAVTGCGATDNASLPEPARTVLDITCLRDLETSPAPDVVLPAVGLGPDGQKVDVASIYRIVTISSGSAEIISALGLKSSLVGVDLGSALPDAEELMVVNPGHEPSLEIILSLQPSVVVSDASAENQDINQALQNVGISVVVIPQADEISEIGPRISTLAQALGVALSGEALIATLNDELAELSKTAPNDLSIAFLYLRGNAGVYLIGGKGSGADSIINSLGAQDVGTKLGIDGFAPLTAEALAKANPDVLMVMNNGLKSVGGIEKLLALPGVSATAAGRNRAVIQADDRVLLAFGSQTAKVVSCLADQLAAVTTESS